MKTGRWSRVGWCVAFAASAMVAAPPGATAQVDDQACRCVDGDGNAIDDCTCFRMPDVPRIMAFGRDGLAAMPFPASRPRLGVTVSTDQDDAVDGQGARVSGVMEDGPAADAGIREGDIITNVDGRSLFEPLQGDAEEDFDLDESIPVQRLLAIARDLEPGESVEVGYLRDGQARTAIVEVEDLSTAWGAWGRNLRGQIMPQMEDLRERLRDERLDLDFDPVTVGPGMARYGLQMVELNPALGEYFGATRGVLVTDVDDRSPLGLQPGDVILRVGDREVATPDRVRRVLGTYDGDEAITFRVRRQGREIDVSGRLAG